MLNNRKGISVIEVSIAMGLLALAVKLGSDIIAKQVITKNIQRTQMMVRSLAIQTTQEVTLNYRYYPPVHTADPSEKSLFLACYNKNGDPLPNKFTNTRDFQFYVKKDYSEDSPTGGCEGTGAFFEVRFLWETPFNNKLVINVLNLKLKKSDPKFLLYKNFKIFAK